MPHCVYNLATSEWRTAGIGEQPYDSLIEGSVFLTEWPDHRLTRYNGAGGVRAATVQEIADYDTARQNDRALSDAEQKALKAALLVTRDIGNDLHAAYRALLDKVNEDRVARGLTPVPAATLGTGAQGQLTVQDLRDKFIAAWKALP